MFSFFKSTKREHDETEDDDASSVASLNRNPTKKFKPDVVEYESEAEEAAPPAPLRWSYSPEDSYSDWAIKINSEEDPAYYEIFHVHKSVLVLHSSYFRDLFEASATKEGCELTFHNKAIDYFGNFLDYVYDTETLVLESENATVFHFLGRFFHMKHLRWVATEFWRTNMVEGTVAGYYKDSLLFNDHRVFDAVVDACCSEDILLSFDENSPIFAVPSPKLWLALLERVDNFHSQHLSVIVNIYRTNHYLDAETFLKLTDSDYMPLIDSSVAMGLVDFERIECGTEHLTELTSLQKRCIPALVKNRKQPVNEYALRNVERQSKVFIAELYRQSIKAAQLDAGFSPPEADDSEDAMDALIPDASLTETGDENVRDENEQAVVSPALALTTETVVGSENFEGASLVLATTF